jgi:hypothetical protein
VKKIRYYIIILCFLVLESCFSFKYSFKGISIPTDVKTFYIENVKVDSRVNAPANIGLDFFEALQARITNESKLKFVETDPDLNFIVTISNFSLNQAAPQEGNTTALNRLEISVKIAMENAKHEEESWNKNYTDFQDFDSTQDLFSVQDELIATIFEEMTERIFNDSFTNW